MIPAGVRLACAAAAVICASCSVRTARAPQAPPAVRHAMHRQIQGAVDLGDGDWTVRELRGRIAANPDDRSARFELAGHYSAVGFEELAAEHYRLAAERWPEDGEARLHLARSLRRLGQNREALRTLEAWIEGHDQAEADYFSLAGILHDDLGELGEGEWDHRLALARAPGRAELLNNLGYNLLLQGKRADAAEELKAALRIKPRWETARNNLAAALADDPREAVVHLQSVTDPATARSNLAAILIEQGRYEEARRELNRALEHRRDHPAALANLALVATLDGRPAVIEARERTSGIRRVARAVRQAFREPEPLRRPEKPVRRAAK